jgi:hypothetical protein
MREGQRKNEAQAAQTHLRQAMFLPERWTSKNHMNSHAAGVNRLFPIEKSPTIV